MFQELIDKVNVTKLWIVLYSFVLVDSCAGVFLYLLNTFGLYNYPDEYSASVLNVAFVINVLLIVWAAKTLPRLLRDK